MAVNVERMRLWINALRSGNYRQTQQKLYNSETGGYCCLGVAAAVCLENMDPGEFDRDQVAEMRDNLLHGYLPHEAVAKWYGWTSNLNLPDALEPITNESRDPVIVAYVVPGAEPITSADGLDDVEKTLRPHPTGGDARQVHASSVNDFGNWTFDDIADALERTYVGDPSSVGSRP